MRRASVLLVGLSVVGVLFLAGCGRTVTPLVPLTVSAPPELYGVAASLVRGYNAHQQTNVASVTEIRQRQPAALSQVEPESLVLGYLLDTGSPLKNTVVAWDAVAVTVPLTNPVQGLTAAQVRQIYMGKLDNWKSLGGGELAIVPLSRQPGALVWSAFEPWALGGQRLSPNSVMLSGDEAVVATLETEQGAIGYALLRSLNANVRPLRLDGEAPSAAAVQTGRYPLALAVAVFTNGPPRGGAADFIAFLRGREGQRALQEAGLVAAR